MVSCQKKEMKLLQKQFECTTPLIRQIMRKKLRALRSVVQARRVEFWKQIEVLRALLAPSELFSSDDGPSHTGCPVDLEATANRLAGAGRAAEFLRDEANLG